MPGPDHLLRTNGATILRIPPSLSQHLKRWSPYQPVKSLRLPRLGY